MSKSYLNIYNPSYDQSASSKLTGLTVKDREQWENDYYDKISVLKDLGYNEEDLQEEFETDMADKFLKETGVLQQNESIRNYDKDKVFQTYNAVKIAYDEYEKNNAPLPSAKEIFSQYIPNKKQTKSRVTAPELTSNPISKEDLDARQAKVDNMLPGIAKDLAQKALNYDKKINNYYTEDEEAEPFSTTPLETQKAIEEKRVQNDFNKEEFIKQLEELPIELKREPVVQLTDQIKSPLQEEQIRDFKKEENAIGKMTEILRKAADVKNSIFGNVSVVEDQIDFDMLGDEEFQKKYGFSKQEAKETQLKNLGEGAVESYVAKAKRLASQYSGYYKVFRDYDKIQEISSQDWLDMYVEYQTNIGLFGEARAAEIFDKDIQRKAMVNEGIAEKTWNAVNQIGSQAASTAIAVGSYVEALPAYAIERALGTYGEGEDEDFLQYITVDNPMLQYAADIASTGSMWTSQQEFLKENGINQFMITNPDQEFSWATTPFEVVGQHGFTLASMGVGSALSVGGKYILSGSQKALSALSRANKIADATKKAKVLDRIAKISMGVETVYNGAFTPFVQGMAEASFNAIDTKESVLEQGMRGVELKYQKEFNTRLNEKLEQEYENRVNNILNSLPILYTELGGTKDFSKLKEMFPTEDIDQLMSQSQNGAEIIGKIVTNQLAREVEYELADMKAQSIEKVEYEADKAAFRTAISTGIMNGMFYSTLKTLQMTPVAQRATDRIKKSFGIKPKKSKFKTTEKDGKTIVQTENKRQFFVDKFGDNVVTKHLDDIINFGPSALKEPLGEFGEEYMQGVLQSVSEDVARYNITSFVENKYSGDGTAELYSNYAGSMATAWHALGNALVDEENLHAGIMGALGSLVPSFRFPSYKTNIKDSNGNPVFETDLEGNIIKDENGNPIPKKKFSFLKQSGESFGDWWGRNKLFQTGLSASFHRAKQEAIEREETAAALAEMLNDPDFKAKFETVEGAAAFGIKLMNSAREGNGFSFRNNMLGLTIQQAQGLAKLKGTEAYDRIMQHLSGLAEISSDLKFDGTFVDSRAQDIVDYIKKNAAFNSMFEGMSDQEIARTIIENNKKLVQTVKTVETRTEQLTKELGEGVDDDVITSLIWGELSIANSSQRMTNLERDTKERLDRAREIIKSRQPKSISNPTITESDKSILINRGSRKHIESQREKLKEKINELEKDIEAINKVKNPTADIRNNYIRKKRQLRLAKKALKEFDKEKLSEAAANEDYVFTADEILSMDPVSRAKMLDRNRLSIRSEAQKQEIELALSAMQESDIVTGSQTSLETDLIDLGKLQQAKLKFNQQYTQMKAHPEIYNEYFRAAKQDVNELVIQAQADGINKATTYEDFVSRFESAQTMGDDPVSMYRNLSLRAKLDENNPFAIRYQKENNFIQKITRHAVGKASKKNSNLTVSEADLIEAGLFYIIKQKSNDNSFDIEELTADEAFDIFKENYQDFIKFLQDELNMDATTAKASDAEGVASLIFSQIREIDRQENSKIANQEVVKPEIVVNEETTKPYVTETPQKQTEEVVEEEEEQEKSDIETLIEQAPVGVSESFNKLTEYKEIAEKQQEKDPFGVYKIIIDEITSLQSRLLGGETISNVIKELIKQCGKQFKAKGIIAGPTILTNFLNNTSDKKTKSTTIDSIIDRARTALGDTKVPSTPGTQSTTIDLFFTDEMTDATFGSKHRIQDYLENNEIPARTEVFFINYVPNNSDFAVNQDINAQIYAAIKVDKPTDTTIEINGVYYQPIGILPASDNKNMQGSASTSVIRQLAINSNSAEYSIINGYDGQPLISILTSDNIKKQHPDYQNTTIVNNPLSILIPDYDSEKDSNKRRKSLLANGGKIIRDFLAKLSIKEENGKKNLVVEKGNIIDIIKSDRLTSTQLQSIEQEINDAISEGKFVKPSDKNTYGYGYIHGVHQDIVTSLVRLAEILDPKTGKIVFNLNETSKDITSTISNILKSKFTLPNGINIQINSNNTIDIVAGDRKVSVELTPKSGGDVYSNIKDAWKLLKGIVETTSNKEIYYTLDYTEINTWKQKVYDWDNLSDKDKEAIARGVDRMLQGAARIDRSKATDDVIKVTISTPVGKEDRDAFEAGGNTYLQKISGQKSQRQKSDKPITKSVAEIANSIVQKLTKQEQQNQSTSDNEGQTYTRQGKKHIGVTSFISRKKDIQGQFDEVIASRIGNSVDMIIKDLIDGVNRKEYPNMTNDVVESIKNEVSKVLRSLKSRGFKLYAGGFKKDESFRRLALQGTIEFNVGGKTIHNPKMGELDILAVNDTGEVIIIDVKSVRGGNLAAESAQQYAEQLSLYKELLSQQTDDQGNSIPADNIKVALLTIPMDYTINSENRFFTNEDADPKNSYEINQVLYDGGKEFKDAKRTKNKAIKLNEQIKEVPISQIINSALERNPDLIELIDETSQEKQIAQQEYNNSEDTERSAPQPVVTKDDDISFESNEESETDKSETEESDEFDGEDWFNSFINDSSNDYTSDEEEQAYECNK